MQTWTDFTNVQPLAGKMLMNSFLKNRLSHAYLIQGARGTGKKTLAKLIAMTFFCEALQENVHPCLSCHACKRIDSGNHPDVHWIKPDGVSIKNEQIDHLRKEFAYTGLESMRKVYVIEHSETLTVHAANRILKFLEEPNIESVAILLTDHVQAIIPTIRSRCQIIDLKPLGSEGFIKKLLQIDIEEMDEAKARLLSALTHNIDEAIAYHTDNKVYAGQELVRDLLQGLLTKYEDRYLFVHQQWLEILKDKKEQELGMELLLIALRDIVYQQLGSAQTLMFFQENDPLLHEATIQLPQQRLLRMIENTLHAKQKLHQYVHPVLTMEQLVLQF